ncbi:hypothetical protein ACFO5X_15890 [Seohaeicola nanhaiensis]|uniref:Glycosyl transferase n=1 Tax=Seohaeicola nanhaiensis TaxID=1387282 RepID=A0ABV9KJB3_9RHOB
MSNNPGARQSFNVMIVGQAGRLQYECLLFAASLRKFAPDFPGRLFVAVPQPGANWGYDPSIRNLDLLAALDALGAEILPFQNRVFGGSYPHGNKIEALLAMPKGEPFVFFDSDTLITGDLGGVPFDFARPSASGRVEGTWPVPTLYGPGIAQIWRSLYDLFGLDFDSSLDLSQPANHWRRYLYFNAGWFYGPCPRVFGAAFLDYAQTIRDTPPVELTGQSFAPWLDQITLPLVIHALGGARDVLPRGLLDGAISCHYRHFPLLYARESDYVVAALEEVAAPNKIKKILKNYEAIKRTVYQRKGHRVRAMFDRDNLPTQEKAIRNRIKEAGLWIR